MCIRCGVWCSTGTMCTMCIRCGVWCSTIVHYVFQVRSTVQYYRYVHCALCVSGAECGAVLVLQYVHFVYQVRSVVQYNVHYVYQVRSVVQYYVHYVDYNKRLDEWVTEDRLDTRKIEPPQVIILILNTSIQNFEGSVADPLMSLMWILTLDLLMKIRDANRIMVPVLRSRYSAPLWLGLRLRLHNNYEFKNF